MKEYLKKKFPLQNVFYNGELFVKADQTDAANVYISSIGYYDISFNGECLEVIRIKGDKIEKSYYEKIDDSFKTLVSNVLESYYPLRSNNEAQILKFINYCCPKLELSESDHPYFLGIVFLAFYYDCINFKSNNYKLLKLCIPYHIAKQEAIYLLEEVNKLNIREEEIEDLLNNRKPFYLLYEYLKEGVIKLLPLIKDSSKEFAFILFKIEAFGLTKIKSKIFSEGLSSEKVIKVMDFCYNAKVKDFLSYKKAEEAYMAKSFSEAKIEMPKEELLSLSGINFLASLKKKKKV